jgi:hypothetical protein
VPGGERPATSMKMPLCAQRNRVPAEARAICR